MKNIIILYLFHDSIGVVRSNLLHDVAVHLAWERRIKINQSFLQYNFKTVIVSAPKQLRTKTFLRDQT